VRGETTSTSLRLRHKPVLPFIYTPIGRRRDSRPGLDVAWVPDDGMLSFVFRPDSKII
jgi:hypothetical protein